jgi:hypothetical protein
MLYYNCFKKHFRLRQTMFKKLMRAYVGAVVLGMACACSAGSGSSDSQSIAASSDEVHVERSRWVGIGSNDSCGLSWGFDLHQEDNWVKGKLLWETVRYDLRATLTEDGNLHNARARKNSTRNGIFPAPSFVLVNLDFRETRAVGSYSAEITDTINCAAAVELKRYAAEVTPVSLVSRNEKRRSEPERSSR